MSVDKAFNILSKTLGDDFRYKDNLKRFQEAMISTRVGVQKLVDFITANFPDAQYLHYEINWDSTNKVNRYGTYEIWNDNGCIIDGCSLNTQNNALYNQIWDLLYDNEEAMLEGYHGDDLEDGEMVYRLYFEDLVIEQYEEEE